MREPGAATDERDIAALAAVVQGFDRNSISLTIREQPQKGRACRATTKAKWPIEPPPVVELTINSSTNKDILPAIINSPNYFCIAELKSMRNRPSPADNLTGTTVSSLHKVKSNNIDLGVFVFSEIHVKIEGEYVLVFSLLEMRTHNGLPYASKVTSVESTPFTVQHHSKPLGAVKESSTFLKSLANQGVKMRLRKNATNKKKEKDDWTSDLQTATGPPYPGWTNSQNFVPQVAHPPRGPAEDVSKRIYQLSKPDSFSFNTPLETSQTLPMQLLPPPSVCMPYQSTNNVPVSLNARDDQNQSFIAPVNHAPFGQNNNINWGYPPSTNHDSQRQSPVHYRNDSGYVTDQGQPSQLSFIPVTQQEMEFPMPNQMAQPQWNMSNSAYSQPLDRSAWAFQDPLNGYSTSTSTPLTNYYSQNRSVSGVDSHF